MGWINENCGLIVLITAAVIILLLVIGLCLTYYIKKMIAVQKLNFLGLYSIDLKGRENYTKLTVGNRSLNDICISELGIKNGNVNFNLTAIYREKAGLAENAKIIVNQRDSISFELTSEELSKAFLTDANGKRKRVTKLSLYAVDVSGTIHIGKVPAVKKMMKLLRAGDMGKTVSIEPTKAPERAEASKASSPAPAEKKEPIKQQEATKQQTPPYMPPEEEEAQFLEPEAKEPVSARPEELVRLEQAIRSASHTGHAPEAKEETPSEDSDDEVESAIS